MPYPIYHFQSEAVQLEQVGTKRKFWFESPADVPELSLAKGEDVLFKVGRETTGENWAEKAASEISSLLSIPHAEYHLATVGDEIGVISKNLISKGARLVLANEVLAGNFANYEPDLSYRQRQHTVRAAAAVLRNKSINLPLGTPVSLPGGRAVDLFCGYLLLDALIGNTDRHHENWAFIRSSAGDVSLSPTFDHASSLGRELSDKARTDRLNTKNEEMSLSRYASKARSALYGTPSDNKALSTFEAFWSLARIAPDAGAFWLNRLSEVQDGQLAEVFSHFSSDTISEPSMEFALRLLTFNKQKLLEAS